MTLRNIKNPPHKETNVERARKAVSGYANTIIATIFLLLGFVLGRI